VVIEHTFVTTLDSTQAMQAATRFLSVGGFEPAGGPTFPVGGGEWNTLEMRRGKKKAARAKNIAQLPQTAHVQWDRGRVTVALAIEPSYTWGGSTFLGVSFGAAHANPKKMGLHTQMLSAVATGLEQVLVQGASPDTAAQPWLALDEQARRLARRRTLRNVIIVVAVFALFAGMITLIALTAK
jgi:hypothetical protein